MGSKLNIYICLKGCVSCDGSGGFKVPGAGWGCSRIEAKGSADRRKDGEQTIMMTLYAAFHI